jgi:NAD(P)-dependent dehydrogenase (short-subunit alcohol dehydrogenase family)
VKLLLSLVLGKSLFSLPLVLVVPAADFSISQGIGQTCAELFAREGAHVVVTDIDASKC